MKTAKCHNKSQRQNQSELEISNASCSCSSQGSSLHTMDFTANRALAEVLLEAGNIFDFESPNFDFCEDNWADFFCIIPFSALCFACTCSCFASLTISRSPASSLPKNKNFQVKIMRRKILTHGDVRKFFDHLQHHGVDQLDLFEGGLGIQRFVPRTSDHFQDASYVDRVAAPVQLSIHV